jgi:hypothetical protein
VGYFYLTNGASEILVGEDRLVLIRAKSVPLLQVMIAVVVRPGVSIFALDIVQAGLARFFVVIEIITRLFLAAFRASL